MPRNDRDRTASRFVGQRIRDERLKRGMSQMDLMNALQDTGRDFSVTMISHIERPPQHTAHRHRAVTVDELCAIAAIFEVPPATLLPPVPAARQAHGGELSTLITPHLDGITHAVTTLHALLQSQQQSDEGGQH